MRRALAFLLAICIANPPLVEAASAISAVTSAAQDDSYPYEPFTPDQLDNLLAPIALYPDPLLSQVLVAATFVDDVDEAARWVRANGTNGIDEQNWDVSVKAVAHYPTVIAMMADKLDWTTTVGQAYVNQLTDVMMSVQRLRRMAYNVGNLVTTPQQQVLLDDDAISIVPFEPQYIYVPIYDPFICYYRRPYWGVAITFGVGFLIGAWLNRDCDWHRHRIYYHGWNGPGWINRERPYVHFTHIYVDNRYSDIKVNRNINRRDVNVNNIDRYKSIHRDVDYRNVQNNNSRIDRSNYTSQPERPKSAPVNNTIINRNIDTTNPRLDQFRGHETGVREGRPPQAPQTQAPLQGQPQPTPRGAAPGGQPAPTPPAIRSAPAGPPRSVSAPPAAQRAPAPPLSPRVFGRAEGNFDPRASSQRGESSRQSQPSPAPRSAPPSAPQPRVQSRPAPPSSPAPNGGQGRKR